MADRRSIPRQSSFSSISSASSARRTLQHRPSAVSSLHASARYDIFGDEHDLYGADDLLNPADGFHPTDGFQPTDGFEAASTFHPGTATPSSSSSSSTPTPTPIPRTQALSRGSTQRRNPPPRPSDETKPSVRNSIAKNGFGAAGTSRNEFALRHDATGVPQRMISTRSEMSQRPTSMISMFSLPPAQSPYLGATGPSHPYGMYPQDTSLNRTSTVSSSFAGAHQPTHPYGMYAQNTSMDADPLATSTDIASVGFPGLGRQYARRLGADGEDADDIIGPDGHTEQLPPYTRYAEGNGPDKERYAPGGVASASVRSAPSIRSSALEETALAATSSQHERLLPAEDGEGNPEVERPEGTRPKWQRRGRRRLFNNRVPAWMLAIGMLILIALAAIIGGVIGHSMAMVPHKGGDHDQKKFGLNGTLAPDTFPSAYPTSVISITTTLIDAQPVATHGRLPPLPDGEFNFELNAPTDSSSNCVTDPGQRGADVWACSDEGLMSFGVRQSDLHATQVFLSGNSPHGLNYGAQPPTMPGPLGLALMMDVEQPGLGPAFFFQSAYTKQVFVPEQSLNSSLSPRGILDAISRTLYRRKQRIMSGDNPWVCNWNNTLLAGFIYIEDTANNTSGNASMTSSASTAASSPTPTQPPRLRERGKNHAGHLHGNGFWRAEQAANPYPFPMKFEERRTPANTIKPYCQQMTVDDQMNVTPKLNNGQPTIITIEETDPTDQEEHTVTTGVPVLQGKTPRRSEEHVQYERNTDPSACLCQWMT